MSEPMPILFAFREDRFGFRFDIGERAVLGRSPECDLILFDRATSRLHAEIYQSDNGYVLKDLGSTNGTMHNDSRLEGEIDLKRDDEIKVGQEVFLFDPDLDVAVGREGAVLIVGGVEDYPENALAGPPEADMGALDRSCLAPLHQVAAALANKPNKGRVLRQSAYALTKLFGADHIALLWPETKESERLTALLARPLEERLVIPRPLVDLAVGQNQSVIWPYTLSGLDFVKGERRLDQHDAWAMAIPLKGPGEQAGLLYISSQSRQYGAKDLNFLTALADLVASALLNANLIGELEYRLTEEEEELSAGGSFVGEDPQIKALLGTAAQLSQTAARIMITGEVGTGKEVLARRIHSQCPQKNGPFISVNCAAYAPGQIEAVLFGQEAGGLTEEGVPGLMEKADSGSLFLRHVDHLTLSSQVELLRTIEEGVVYRVGSSAPRPSTFRVISSTSVDLIPLMEAGEFREDLYQRLSEITLTIAAVEGNQGRHPGSGPAFPPPGGHGQGHARPRPGPGRGRMPALLPLARQRRGTPEHYRPAGHVRSRGPHRYRRPAPGTEVVHRGLYDLGLPILSGSSARGGKDHHPPGAFPHRRRSGSHGPDARSQRNESGRPDSFLQHRSGRLTPAGPYIFRPWHERGIQIGGRPITRIIL